MSLPRIVLVFVSFTVLAVVPALSQIRQAWVARYNGPANGGDAAYAIAVDKHGNAYVTGISRWDSEDDDIVTIKYSSSGDEVWVQRYNGPDNKEDRPVAIAVDTAGNVIVSGYSRSSTTFDDIVTIMYAPDGSQRWLQRFDGPTGGWDDRPAALAVDSAGNVYVAGRSGYPDNSFGLWPVYEYTTVKYGPDGVQHWAKHYRSDIEPQWGSEGGSFAQALAVDALGNVYVTGQSNEDRDHLTTAIATIKYNAAGVEQWVQRIFTIPKNIGAAIAVNQSGEVYVTGLSAVSSRDGDCYTVKYAPDGVILWERRYAVSGGERSQGRHIRIDGFGNVIVSAASHGGSSTGHDIALLKYTRGGDLLWATRYDGPGHSTDLPQGLALDTLGNAYVTGGSIGTVDYDCVTLKYSPDGSFEWEQRYHNPGGLSDNGLGIAVSRQGEIYVAGSTHDTASGVDYLTVKYSQLRITRPRPGERWISGRQDTIRWTGGLAGEFLDVDYSLDNGQTYRSIDTAIPADSGYYLWTHPDTLLSTRARIRLSDFQSSTAVAESDTFRMKGYVMTRLDATGQYEPFTFTEDRWSFGNIRNNMWPLAWWSQFDYLDGDDPYAFHPYPDWEPFESAPGPFYPDWPLFVQVFGAENCYWGNPVSGSYKDAATAKWDAIHRRWAGSCSGLSLSSILGFDRKDALRARYQAIPDFGNLISVALNDSIRLVINELANHWHAEQHQQVVITQKVKTPTQTINDLKALFLGDGGDHAYLYFANNGQGGGAHAVVPYKVTDSANTSVHYIHLYDNSWPNAANAQVRVDTALNGGNGAWTYALWPGWGGLGKLYVMDPASTYLSRPILPTAPPADVAPGKRSASTMMEFVPTLDASILILDSQGNSLGYTDSTVIEQIPGAEAIIPPTGSLTPPYSYLLPEGAYTIRLSAFSDSVSKLSLFTDSTIIALSRSDASNEQADYIAFDGGLSVRSEDPQAKSMKLKLIFTEESTEEKVFSVNDWSLSQSDSMWFSRAADDNLTIRNFGGQKSYALDVKRASEAFQQRFIQPLIQLGPNSSHRIEPAWDDLNQPAVIYVDLGNDDSIDDTLVVDNTVSADERNSPTLPAEYTLAQNYPNPFNPSTTIRYSLPVRSHVTLTVYNTLGQQITTLVEGEKEAGYHEVNFNASDLASGVYLYRLTAGDYVQTRRLILLR